MDSPILRLAIRQEESTTTSTSATSTTSTSASSTSTTETSTTPTSTSSTTSSTTPSTTSETTSSTTSSTTSTTSDTTTSSTSTSSSTSSSTPTPTPTSSSLITTDASGQTTTVVTVITAEPSSTRGIAPSATSKNDNGGSGFFNNTGAVAGTFTAVGIVALILIFVVATMFVRRRRAKAWDREIAEAAREARATGTTGLPDEYLDEPGPHPFTPVGGGYLGPGGGGGGGYPASMSEAGSHGTYGAYGQAPLGHSDGGEMYQMRDLGASGPGPGGLFDHNAAYAAGAAGLGAGAAGIGIARARSQHGPHSANSGPNPNDPNGYYSYPSSASSPPANLERNLSNGSQHTNSTGYGGQPSSFAAALAEGAGGSGPYPAFLAPGGMQQAMTQGQRSVPQSVLDAAGLGAAATSGSGSPSPGSPPPASTATSTTAAPEKESYAAHYARPVGSSPKQSMEGGEDAYGGISGGGLAYDESEGGHGADKGLAPQAQAQASRTSSDSAHHLPNPFGRAMESDSEEEESEEGGGRKVLRVANE